MAQNICICPKCKTWVADGMMKCSTCGSTLLSTHYTDLFFSKLSLEEQSERVSEYIEKDKAECSKDSSGSVEISRNSTLGQSSNGYVVPEENGFARVLRILGILFIIIGFLTGLILGRDNYGDIYFGIFLIYFLVGLISGIFTMAFGEVINLLHSINKKLDR